jgi:DNA polymerase-3 subunit epsilon
VNYLVLDLETANPDCTSICQMGLVQVCDGEIVGTASHLIDPQDSFDPWNVRVHGIRPEDVAGRPTFADVFPALAPLLEGRIVVTHGSFDRVAITRACEKYRVSPAKTRWLDNQTVVRRTWKQFARRGYSLGNLAQHFGIAFQHHDALEDAIATAHVFRRALADSGRTASEWFALIGAQAACRARIVQPGAANAVFSGQSIVFTGRMRVPRQEAARLASERGFDVLSTVTAATTFLCVGAESGASRRSSKERDAEKLQTAGNPISIIPEDLFWRLVDEGPRHGFSTSETDPTGTLARIEG